MTKLISDNNVSIFEFEIKSGSFRETITVGHVMVDISTSAKQLFEQIVQDYNYDTKNKLFVMKTASGTLNEYVNFYSIRTNTRGTIDDIRIIHPNNVDKELIIDAILGCKISDNFAISCTDAVLKKCIILENNEFKWSHDTSERLSKVNPLRLREYYKKIKELT